MGLRLGFGIVLGALLTVVVRGQVVDEYQVKAAFLYNFARFVEWPPQVFKGPTDPIAICILGQSPFGGALEQAVSGKTVDNRGFVIRQVWDAQQANSCQMLFIGSSERKRGRSILTEIKAQGILTVGESDGFASEGGIVNFKLEEGRVRIQINVSAADQAKLQISSKLLGLAQIVKK